MIVVVIIIFACTQGRLKGWTTMLQLCGNFCKDTGGTNLPEAGPFEEDALSGAGSPAAVTQKLSYNLVKKFTKHRQHQHFFTWCPKQLILHFTSSLTLGLGTISRNNERLIVLRSFDALHPKHLPTPFAHGPDVACQPCQPCTTRVWGEQLFKEKAYSGPHNL